MTDPRDTVEPGAWWKREQMGRPRPTTPMSEVQPETVARELHLYGKPHVVIVQCNEDPGDMGEPRMVSEDDTTYVFVPAFDLWPSLPVPEPLPQGDGLDGPDLYPGWQPGDDLTDRQMADQAAFEPRPKRQEFANRRLPPSRPAEERKL